MPDSRDPLDSFRDLQGPTYPGSKKVRRSQQRAQPAEERDERRWDAHPVMLTIDGKPTELFTVGHLGAALNRSGAAIRKWEELGYLPPADYRFPGRTKEGQRRLYTRAQVEGIAAVAQDEGVLDGRRKVKFTKFTERVLPLFGPNARKVSDPVGKVRP